MLPAAFVGKICNFFNIYNSFRIANIFNLLWSSFGIFLVIINTFIVTKNYKFWIILIIIFFSGMDILNTNIINMFSLHIERHSFYQYSSNTTLLFWVYNQTIAIWLIILDFIRNKNDISKFGFYALLLFYYAPLPFIGTVLYLFTFTIIELINSIKNSKFNQFIHKLCSLTNILSLLIIFPVIYFYYKCNDNNIGNIIGLSTYNMNTLQFYYKFVICEAGLLLLFIMYKYYKNVLFLLMTFHIFIIPILSIPSAPDFCMRTSIPTLFIFMIFIIKFLSDASTNKLLKASVIICLIIGTATPAFEYARGIIFLTHKTIEPIIKDEIITLNNKITDNSHWQLLTENDYIPNFGNYKNYGTTNPEKHIFFKYIAKH